MIDHDLRAVPVRLGRRHGGPTADATFDQYYQGIAADDPFWQLPFGPTTLTDPANLFSGVVYLRGAMTLHALRRLVGDGAFFRILRTWTTSHRDGNVTTADFIRLSERTSGRSLTSFFTTWLDTPGRPGL